MKKTFDELSHRVSRETTERYSTSFSFGIMALNRKIRQPIYAIYGFVRLADEIVDSFHGYDKTRLISRLRQQTEEALDEKISLNPILNSFQETVHAYNIDRDLIWRFMRSMEMDLEPIDYNTELYHEYILGSAKVVGLMCLQVFVHGDKKKFDELKPYAMKLGAAFQKVNFLRDIKHDFQILERTYFPGVRLDKFDNETKLSIENDIENDFHEALIGIRRLPISSRFGVLLAYKYYKLLFAKIKRTPAQRIMKERLRVHNARKISLMMSSYFQCKIAAFL